jgi:thioredoxin 1
MLFAKSAGKKIIRSALTLHLLIIVLLVSPSGAGSAPAKDMTVEEAYPGLATGMLKLARLSDLGKGEILKTKDLVIKESSLDETLSKMGSALRQQLEKYKFFLLEDHATDKIVYQEARKAGFKQDEPQATIISKFLLDKASQVTITDTELRQFYAQNKDALGGLPFDQVRDRLEGYLIDEKKQRVIGAYILGLGEEISIQVDATWVQKQNRQARDNPVDQARSSGKPTMVEFGAVGCIACDMMQPVLENLRKKYQDRLNIVFIHVGEEKILGVLYGITSIPVQAFFDRSGKEVFRHTGFFDQVEVEKKLAEMGVN